MFWGLAKESVTLGVQIGCTSLPDRGSELISSARGALLVACPCSGKPKTIEVSILGGSKLLGASTGLNFYGVLA